MKSCENLKLKANNCILPSMREATIGLEIHAELKTKTKMFCRCANDPDKAPANTHICPICMAHPGALPTINKEAVKSIVKVGLALGGNIADFSEFDRKSYFYPDMPKAYQISQFKYPIVSGGSLAGVQITRVHLEEDTARSLHDQDDAKTLIDFNRSGVPLMELVTEPVVKDAEHARRFAKELQLLLRRLGVSDANMEQGQMRVEANISLRNPDGSFGTKVEVKNLNSFKSVFGAIEYEIKRQNEILSKGGVVEQETRGWDENKLVTFSQRKKEGSADYRYFPDPDLPKMVLSEVKEFDLETLKDELPELPAQTKERLSAMGLASESADILVADSYLLSIFDYAVNILGQDNAKLIANYLLSDMVSSLQGRQTPGLERPFADIMLLLSQDKISSRVAKDLIAKITQDTSIDINSYVQENNLMQNNDPELLKSVLQEVISQNAKAVEDFKSGNEKALGAIIGQSMKKLKEQGISADPRALNNLAKELIS